MSVPRGAITLSGDVRHARRLGEALGARGEEAARSLTHGFHSYPARFHPLLCRQLLDDLPAGMTVLDPFVGSGTTLIEAVLRGAHTEGVDLNPLAVELTRLKATPLSPE